MSCSHFPLCHQDQPVDSRVSCLQRTQDRKEGDCCLCHTEQVAYHLPTLVNHGLCLRLTGRSSWHRGEERRGLTHKRGHDPCQDSHQKNRAYEDNGYREEGPVQCLTHPTPTPTSFSSRTSSASSHLIIERHRAQGSQGFSISPVQWSFKLLTTLHRMC